MIGTVVPSPYSVFNIYKKTTNGNFTCATPPGGQEEYCHGDLGNFYAFKNDDEDGDGRIISFQTGNPKSGYVASPCVIRGMRDYGPCSMYPGGSPPETPDIGSFLMPYGDELY